MAETPESEPSDFELMLAVKRGDVEAFRDLVQRHQHRVVGTVTKMLGGETDADDVAQQVFVRVWKSAPRYEPSAKFTTWLMTITRNLVFNEMRRRERSRLVPLQTEETDHAAMTPDTKSITPDHQLLVNELQDAIDGAIQELPEQQRMAVVLRRFEEMPYEEIAEVLGTTVPAVKSILFRARSELKLKLARYLDGAAVRE
jgi:RNA polymerase sigma-70 factor (ECF subfamily)